MPGFRSLSSRGKSVALRHDLDHYGPRLRRYARGLVAGQPDEAVLAEDLVRATFANQNQIGRIARWFDLEGSLYAHVTRIHRDATRSGHLGPWLSSASGHSCAGGATARPERTTAPVSSADAVAVALGDLALEEREALLLVVVEGCRYARAARILKVSRRVLIARLSRARTALSRILPDSIPMRSGRPRAAHLHLVK
jgi:RNA polymerase sigma-70 factor (ECF subfamily)